MITQAGYTMLIGPGTGLLLIMIPLRRSLDIVARRARKSVHVHAGIRTNGTPHAGTLLTLAYGFLFAREIRAGLGAEVQFRFQALDNATTGGPHDTYRHGFWQTVSVREEMHRYYLDYLNLLSEQTGIPFQWTSYSEIQQEFSFRKKFLYSLNWLTELKQFHPFEALLPSKTLFGIRLPCPACGLFEKEGNDVVLQSSREDSADFESFCPVHEKQWIHVTTTNQVYLDLTPLYRNIVKEAMLAENDTTSVIIKAPDWLLPVILIDRGLDLLDCPPEVRPVRLFVPLVVSPTGVKLSKTGVRDKLSAYEAVPPHLLDASLLKERFPDYATRMLQIAEITATDADHSFLNYACAELEAMLRNVI